MKTYIFSDEVLSKLNEVVLEIPYKFAAPIVHIINEAIKNQPEEPLKVE